ncbi:hypothetical protein N657DRAFT_632722 [Parathielavia appendiculata]|uniref:GPI inositol-deacylase n=1 Tax=Parathielavia appendiculata TaxID=2587402 RepID=A0AAN6Z5C8_9PEZI|nr:hypothetical protein N657DRAFT_632722 [Parathielavia appendiculata]
MFRRFRSDRSESGSSSDPGPRRLPNRASFASENLPLRPSETVLLEQDSIVTASTSTGGNFSMRRTASTNLSGTISAPPRNAHGHTLVHDPQDSADIIFVHGLGGSSWAPWAVAFQSDYFGYNANWRGPDTTLSILEFAKGFLVRMRGYGDCESNGERPIGKRPIIFVAHSMGGLVVKAYVLGRYDEHFTDMISNVHGIVFLSTPHRGSSHASSLNNLLSVMIGTSSKVYVAELDSKSTSIEDINEQFQSVSDPLRLVSMYETLPTRVPPGTKKLIVGKDTGILNYPRKVSGPADADHHTICKYRSRVDDSYVLFITFLKQITRDLVPPLASHPTQGPLQERVHILESILGIVESPTENLDKFASQGLQGSGEWLRGQKSFEHWLSDPSGETLAERLVRLHQDVGDALSSQKYQTIWTKAFEGILFKMDIGYTLHWVLDAVDEAENPLALLKLVSQIRSSSCIKVMLLSRPNKDIAGICGYFVRIDGDSVTLIHATARKFLVTPDGNEPEFVPSQDGHSTLAKACLQYLSDDRWRRILSQIPEADAMHKDRLAVLYDTHPLLSYALNYWAYHYIKLYLKKRKKNLGKFGNNLAETPSSIFKHIPPLCSRDSIIGQFGAHQENALIQVTGISSRTWDDNLARLSVGQDEMASKVRAIGVYFLTLVSSNGTVIIWSAETCEELRRLEHEEWVVLFETNATGSAVATSGRATFKIWDISSGQLLHSITKDPQMRLIQITFGAVQTDLVVAYDDCSVVWYDMVAGTQVEKFTTEESHKLRGCPRLTVLSPDQSRVAIAFRGRPVLLWETNDASLNPPRRCLRAADEIRSSESDAYNAPEVAIWHPDVESLFILYQDTVLVHWDLVKDEISEFDYTEAREMVISSDGLIWSTDYTATIMFVHGLQSGFTAHLRHEGVNVLRLGA